jgi:hypothetical protein
MSEQKKTTKEDVLQYIKSMKGGVTFVQLINKFTDLKGDHVMTLKENLVLWVNVSESCCKIINELREDKEIGLQTTSPFIYALDGRTLNIPVAKQIPKNPYKKERWLPVVMNPLK